MNEIIFLTMLVWLPILVFGYLAIIKIINLVSGSR